MARSAQKPPKPAPSSPVEPAVGAWLAHARAHCAAHHAQLTPLRTQVLERLLARNRATKAYDLLADMQQRQPGIAPMTVYRALDFLVQQGLVHKIASTSSFVVCQHSEHPHEDPMFLICERCGDTTEWSDPGVSTHLSRALRESGFHVHDTEIKGECARCSAADKPANA